MSNHHISKFILIATIATIAAVAVLAVGAGGAWAVAPVKVTLNSQFGREVDLTHVGNGPELEDLCTVASKDECRPGQRAVLRVAFMMFMVLRVHPVGTCMSSTGAITVCRSSRRVVSSC